MNYFGEFISLTVAISWTATALFAEYAGKRLGSLQLNVIRMVLSLLMLGITLWCFTGSPFPQYTNNEAWLWLSLSGFVGYVFGDYCLFSTYVIIGSRFGQLFMTLSPLFAAIAGFILLGETLSLCAMLGIAITLFGIGMSVLNKGKSTKFSLKLPLKGLLFGIGAAVGQGIGLVLSKIGMNYYQQSIPHEMTSVMQMLPFTATFIRAITGMVGFLIIMMFQKKFSVLTHSLRDKKGMRAALLATITGPFIGVSLSLMAVQYTAVGIAQTIMALTPIFIILPAHLIFKQKITSKEVIGAFISVIGVCLFFV